MSGRWGIHQLVPALIAAVGRLDKSFNIQATLDRLQSHTFTKSDFIYVFHIIHTLFWFIILRADPWAKLGIPLLFTLGLLIPFTSQFVFRAIPVFAWLLALFTNRDIPTSSRPTISVFLLPTLESVLFGANISDILTRYTHWILDIMAWLPYGLLHFTIPFVVAFFLWVFRPKQALHLWARTFGYMNLVGVWAQILIPCAPPWYEIIYGLTPAQYGTKGSAGGLLRIDDLFGNSGYAKTFGASPLVFGAFPSLHAGCGTLEALFVSHFFPQATPYIWTYVAVLFWSTMYLSHHYLIDVVAGSCFAVLCFHLFMPLELMGGAATAKPGANIGGTRSGRNKYAMYDLDAPARGNGVVEDVGMMSEASDEEADIGYYRSPRPGAAPSAGGVAGGERAKKSHKHTASVASLMREGERVEEGWGPIGGGFSLPPTPTRAELDMGDREDGSRR